MNTQERACPQCSDPVEGRANKTFCSAACRAQHFRDRQDEADESTEENFETRRFELPPSLATEPSAAPVPLPDGNAAPPEPWYVTVMRMEKAKKQAAVCDRLHQSYVLAITNSLRVDGDAFDKESLEMWIQELDQLGAQYRLHPNMREPHTGVPDRLEDIYWLHDKFRRLLAALQSPPEPGTPAAGAVTFELLAKRRARFRTHLLPD